MEQYYYISSSKQQVGPISLEEMLGAPLLRETSVWKTGLPKWVKAEELPELASLFQSQAAAAPVQDIPAAQPATANGAPVNEYLLKPNNGLVWAIFSCVFCCLPTGIYAIILASKVDSLWLQKRYDESRLMAEKARKWSIIGAVVGIVGSILYLIFTFFVLSKNGNFPAVG